MTKIRKRLKRLREQFNNKGFTLVELLASFVLIGLFMVAASKVIANTVAVYYEAKGITNGMQVSSIISTKIRSEIESARAKEITISKDGSKISFTDSGGTSVYITANSDGYMVIHYDIGKENNDWTFDKKAYMGYTITKLTFSEPGSEYYDNIVYMELTLHSGKYGDYTVSEYIECYNLDTTTDLIKREEE